MKKEVKKFLVLLVVFLIINLPVVEALTFSNIRTTDLDQRSAVIRFETNESSLGTVFYSPDKNLSLSVKESKYRFNHSLALVDLEPEKTYYYKVVVEKEEEKFEDDNKGNLYSFKTLANDTPPQIRVFLPNISKESYLDIFGETEALAKVNLYLENKLERTALAKDGTFFFPDLNLKPNTKNLLLFEAIDQSNQKIKLLREVYVDTEKPKLTLENISDLVEKNEIEIKGTVSEESLVKISVNNQTVFSNQTKSFSAKLSLKEGENNLSVTAADSVGWQDSFEKTVYSDTLPPQIQVTFETGQTYYQTRAEATISGKTEPFALVYLYIFDPYAYEKKPDFTKPANYFTVADEKGEFSFKEIDLEKPLWSLEPKAPKQVPPGLEEEVIYPVEIKPGQEEYTKHLYFIAEDRTGKTGFIKQLVQIKTCFSPNFDFNIQPLINFQLPSRLDPEAISQGIQIISAVFNLTYTGFGQPEIEPATGRIIQPGVDILSVQFEKACLEGMQKDKSYEVSCQILPARPEKQLPNSLKNVWYVQWRLMKNDQLKNASDDFWNEFQKRQMLFPLRVKIQYKERNPYGQYLEPKTQFSCLELGYFVDVPIESKHLVPDFLADEGVRGINWTIEQINKIMPYLEKVIYVTGFSCMASFMGKTFFRWARIFSSYLEPWLTKGRENPPSCPARGTQNLMPLNNEEKELLHNLIKDMPEKYQQLTLEEVCPYTSFFWKAESYLQYAYRGLCDRVFCKTAPAKWTEDKPMGEIKLAEFEEQKCSTFTGRTTRLIEIKNCGKELGEKGKKLVSPALLNQLRIEEDVSCYQLPSTGDYYYLDHNKNPKDDTVLGIYKLTRIEPIAGQLGIITGPSELIVREYPLQSKNFHLAPNQKCSTLCAEFGFEPAKPPCQEQDLNGIVNISQGEIAVGFSSDCFFGNKKFKQCVCKIKVEKPEEIAPNERIAKEKDKWSYRQATIFSEDRTKGIYYPKERYYAGRDFTANFGLNHPFDWGAAEGPTGTGNGTITKIDAFTDHIGAFQTLCLSGIRGRLHMLRSILIGMRECIIQAKYSGLQDAGLCKELFSQYVCGLFYKVLAYFSKGCYPRDARDLQKEGEVEGIGEAVKSGLKAITEVMDTSSKELMEDYGNANLAQYFGTGVESFTRGICMVAFGYDWVFGMDFIQDAAYQVPFKTSPLIFPAERELVAFNPAKGNAIYNYRLAVTIFPGCKIVHHSVELACINGQELGREGVDCSQQQCDCLYIKTPVISTRETIYSAGPLEQGSYVSLPIKGPYYATEAPYRYDHVIVRLTPEPQQDRTKCFGEGNLDGVFYQPIKDVTVRPLAECQVDMETGEYRCLAWEKIFEPQGKACFGQPPVTCFNKEGLEVPCQTIGLYSSPEELRFKPLVKVSGEQLCLYGELYTGTKRIENWWDIPERIASWGPELEFEEFPQIGGYQQGVIWDRQSSYGATCSAQASGSPTSSGKIIFYTESKGYEYKIKVSPVGIVNIGGYGIDQGGYVYSPHYDGTKQKDAFTLGEIRNMRFTAYGLTLTNVISPSEPSAQCVYDIISAQPYLSPYAPSTGMMSLRLELRYPGPTGCEGAYQRIPQTYDCLTEVSETMTFDVTPTLTLRLEAGKNYYKNQNYQQAATQFQKIINEQQGNIEEVLAYFWLVASYIQWDKENYKENVKNIIALFENRKNVFDQKLQAEAEKNAYQKVKKYLEEINQSLNK